MTAVTHQKYDLRREVQDLVKAYMDTKSEEEAKEWAVNLAAAWAGRMTVKDLRGWVERLRSAVDEPEEMKA